MQGLVSRREFELYRQQVERDRASERARLDAAMLELLGFAGEIAEELELFKSGIEKRVEKLQRSAAAAGSGTDMLLDEQIRIERPPYRITE